ncbi:uncharacterized protein LOC120724925 isoform X3 [Simochromis diagramma]|uniref:uncharacterized protein LOC120724925 isoform X3 n=1 Tax=Simochromis diagramma TaxID=43689 RepID=UPI001A7EDE73|nr:uncharacterized protein LOC120724925 isoform X3 [Simochromis diagramma]
MINTSESIWGFFHPSVSFAPEDPICTAGEIMDGLLKEIRSKDQAAASVLEQADLRSDSDLQSLTLQDLGLLFPGVENVKLRRDIFDIINKQKPIGELIEEFKHFIPHDSLRAALTENGVLVDYLKMLKEMKTQMNKDFLDPHINLLEDFRKSQPSQDQDKGEIMDILLKEIKRKDEVAANKLEEEGLRADSDLQLLTLQDLRLLLPGVENVKRIREIFDIIHKQKPIGVLIEKFKDFIPHESFRAALTENGVLVGYLKMLKEMKIQMNKVQDFLDAHINLLEDLRKSQPLQNQDKGSSSSGPVKRHNSQTSDPPQMQQEENVLHKEKRHKDEKAAGKLEGSSSSSENSQTSDLPEIQQATLKYKMVISGKTFNAHQQILEKVKALREDPDLNLIEQKESDQDCQAIIVFCPIVSRMGTDIDAAMTQVKGSQPVILVLMHHAHEPKCVTLMKTWDGVSNVVLLVHVFYHETVHGLLQCQQNNDAISVIRKALLEHADIQTIKDTSGKTQNVAASYYGGIIGNPFMRFLK